MLPPARAFSDRKENIVDLLTYLYVVRRLDSASRINNHDMSYVANLISTHRLRTNHLEVNRDLINCQLESGTSGFTRMTTRMTIKGRLGTVNGSVITLKTVVS